MSTLPNLESRLEAEYAVSLGDPAAHREFDGDVDTDEVVDAVERLL